MTALPDPGRPGCSTAASHQLNTLGAAGDDVLGAGGLDHLPRSGGWGIVVRDPAVVIPRNDESTSISGMPGPLRIHFP
ncbi:hypothetical protein ATKI12_6878 [Kitasatospora sp. Ki12]